MNPNQRNAWERKRAVGRPAWIVRSVLLTVCWAALGGSLAIWMLGGQWKGVLYLIAGSALGALLGALHRWSAKERAYRADLAQEALHHLS